MALTTICYSRSNLEGFFAIIGSYRNNRDTDGVRILSIQDPQPDAENVGISYKSPDSICVTLMGGT